MDYSDVERMIRHRAEKKVSQKQGIEFLREYREHPEKFLPLIDRQYKHFDKWEDEYSRNRCWDAGIYEENCPYFAECWEIVTSTVVTVYISAKWITREPDLKYILVEFIRNGMITGLSKDRPHIEASRVTDGAGNEFYSINMVIGNHEKGQLIQWGKGHVSYDELNAFNEGKAGDGLHK